MREPGDLTQLVLDPVEQRLDKLQCAFCGVGVAGAQAQVQQIAGLGHRGNQRMVHVLMVVAVIRRARLPAVHLDGQRIQIDDKVPLAPRIARRRRPASSHRPARSTALLPGVPSHADQAR